MTKVEAIAKRTRPPRRFTDATLLTAMETAGATLDDRELSEAMKERGLGTPATRAEIIETLLRRAYAERQGRALTATETGVRLIDLIHPQVKSPALTGEWEADLDRIRRGTLRLPDFMQRIESFVRELVGQTLAAPRPAGKAAEDRRPPEGPAPVREPRRSTRTKEAPRAVTAANDAERPSPRPTRESPPSPALPRTPVADLDTLLRDRFRLPSFRPQQEAVCRAVVDGHDVLLVMPTGAGKSLCYQLPGLARGGTTLVVSPLIALMEDQTQKLQDLGLRAERIHSGRERQASRAACHEYLEGRLDFLFIAPERLRVAGFPELLAKRRPTLVAIDEAHCISEWGHDFRPDYRLLGERLPGLRPAVIVALTATATPRVQADIAAQLGLATPRRFIHGFRRTNIAIEAAVLKPSERTEAARGLLRSPERRPAIVYATTRKGAEEVALGLRADGQQAAAYHAGMAAAERDRVQSGFQAGAIDVVVATIAFGMGIDKADIRTVLHTGLPSSVEGYYQEIGRAGRDGQPSRAILLYSYADRRTHDFFLDRDYPPPEELDRVYRALASEPEPIEKVVRKTRLAAETVEVALDRLWAHGGAIVLGEDVRRGRPDWRPSYVRQREHRQGQIEEVLHFAESRDCRMLALLRHFGDEGDRRGPCGHCDSCAPNECVARRWRAPSRREVPVLEGVLDALRRRDGQGSGALHRDCGGGLERKEFERLLSGLAREGLIETRRDSFEKNGETIAYQRVSLTGDGRRAGAAVLTEVRVEDEGTAGGADRTGLPLAKPRPKGGRGGGRRARGEAGEVHGDGPLIARLKAWRAEEARRRGIPAFRIFTDRTLLALADEHPANEADLLAVSGIGPKLAERYAATLLALVAGGERA